MTSIQERLQLKRVPLDTWTIREKLCLASAVVRSGDQNWMSVSRALKTIGDTNRPTDWYSQKSCAAQYGALLEHVETPKRKKRNSEGAVETPQESILKRLTQERITEIQSNLDDLNRQYEVYKAEIKEIRDPNTSEERVEEIWAAIELEKKAKEKEQTKRLAWLREREDRKARSERAWKPTMIEATPPMTPVVPPPASPLLTSLLKSSPVVTTPQHISHPANVVDTVSPSAGAPTLSMLLDKQSAVAQEHKNAAIEHIKSQLVQIEQQLKASSTSAPSPSLVTSVPVISVPTSVDKIEIDDIEIKAEDVYAFSDIDIEIPPVSSIHKTSIARPIEKAVKKEDSDGASTSNEAMLEPNVDEDNTIAVADVEQPATLPEKDVSPKAEVIPDSKPIEKEEKNPEEKPAEETVIEDAAVRISFPEVKFPTPEIKVIQPEESKPIEEVKEVEAVKDVVEEERTEESQEESSKAVTEEPEKVPEETAEVREDAVPEVENAEVSEPTEVPSETDATGKTEKTIEVTTQLGQVKEVTQNEEISTEKEVQEEVASNDKEVGAKVPVEAETEVLEEKKDTEDVVKEIKKETENNEETPSTNEAVPETWPVKVEEPPQPALLPSQIKTEKAAEVEELAHNETDDDTPMELSREEEKDGKKKRDYSRKRKSESKGWSGSESAPESPASSDIDKDYRLWKRSVMLVYNRLCAHKYASLFLRPITDEQAPGYSSAIHRPMDLITIKKNIEAGLIRTTAEFRHNVCLMLCNALMYNGTTNRIHQMAKEMLQEAESHLLILLQAQAHSGLSTTQPRTNKRRSQVQR